jgi:hypothetical protein
MGNDVWTVVFAVVFVLSFVPPVLVGVIRRSWRKALLGIGIVVLAWGAYFALVWFAISHFTQPGP